MSLIPSIYMCRQCGWLYEVGKGDPDLGIAPGTDVDQFPDDWKCPECGASSDELEEIL
jgi:rubredoxin---NAD+ reductase